MRANHQEPQIHFESGVGQDSLYLNFHNLTQSDIPKEFQGSQFGQAQEKSNEFHIDYPVDQMVSEQGASTYMNSRQAEKFLNIQEFFQAESAPNGLYNTQEHQEPDKKTDKLQQKGQMKTKKASKKQVNSQNGEIKASKSRSELKNYLTFIKKCLLKLLRKDSTFLQSELIQKFAKASKTNRFEFQTLFNSEQSKEFLTPLFLSKKFERELCLSRIDLKNRKFYRQELNLIKKAFILGKLPNL